MIGGYYSRAPVLFAIIMYTVAVMGIIMGAQVGYAADSPDDVVVNYNGTHFAVGEDVAEVNATEATERETEAERALNGTAAGGLYERLQWENKHVEAATDEFVKYTLHYSFSLAAATASAWFFARAQFLPLWLVKGVLNVAAYVPVLAWTGYELLNVARWAR